MFVYSFCVRIVSVLTILVVMIKTWKVLLIVCLYFWFYVHLIVCLYPWLYVFVLLIACISNCAFVLLITFVGVFTILCVIKYEWMFMCACVFTMFLNVIMRVSYDVWVLVYLYAFEWNDENLMWCLHIYNIF